MAWSDAARAAALEARKHNATKSGAMKNVKGLQKQFVSMMFDKKPGGGYYNQRDLARVQSKIITAGVRGSGKSRAQVAKIVTPSGLYRKAR